MLNAMPNVDEVVRVARSLGMRLDREEAVPYWEQVVSHLQAVEEFMRSPIAEERPPILAPDRAPGHRPSEADDPFNAWRWRCEIKAEESGLLAGKKVSFKDHIAVAGIPLTLGSYLMEDYIADFDATVVFRVLAAGGTITGKNSLDGPTNLWGFGLPGDYLRPLNPHDVSHLTGGSSSGSAAAVAAEEVDISFGGDQGGSIRIPAALCGTYGLKPTFGLVSHFGIGYGSDQSIDSTGPMARYAEDMAAALDAVAGYDSYDPRQDRTVPLEIDSVSSLADGVKGVRIGVLEEGFLDAEPDVRDAVLAAVDVLVAAGATATRISVPEHTAACLAVQNGLGPEGNRAIFDIGFFGAFARTYYPGTWMARTYSLFHDNTDHLMPSNKLALLFSEFVRTRYRGTVYAKAQNIRNVFRKAFDSALAQVDVLAMPTCLSVAPKFVESESRVDNLAGSGLTAAGQALTRNSRPFNYTGHPALTVPCGKSRNLPIGMQLVAGYYADPLLLRTAYSFQHAVHWEQFIGLTTEKTQTSSG
jgi:amidase